ncbi:MAG TPA: hypothetical protein VHF01_07110 [Candidatus Acidoferrum sp.]|nr:hypothetical protein [Candidatus Acidoferrum sp.]
MFRLVGNSFGRFKGESDLLYIGCTESAGGTISRRLSDHLPSRADGQNIAQRLLDAQKVGELEVAWKILTTHEEAVDEEARLLRNYYREHIELPPLNRSEPARRARVAIKAVTEYVQTEGHSPEDAPRLAEKVVENLTREKRREKRSGD